jgi:FixJ family two-component response regulator
MKGGAVDFLTKPIDETVLLAAIEHALEKDRVAITDPQVAFPIRVGKLCC